MFHLLYNSYDKISLWLKCMFLSQLQLNKLLGILENCKGPPKGQPVVNARVSQAALSPMEALLNGGFR